MKLLLETSLRFQSWNSFCKRTLALRIPFHSRIFSLSPLSPFSLTLFWLLVQMFGQFSLEVRLGTSLLNMFHIRLLIASCCFCYLSVSSVRPNFLHLYYPQVRASPSLAWIIGLLASSFPSKALYASLPRWMFQKYHLEFYYKVRLLSLYRCSLGYRINFQLYTPC